MTSSLSSSEWSTRTERYCRVWSDELKVSEFNHLRDCAYYTTFHRLVGGVGQCGAVAALFATISDFFDPTGAAGGCGLGTVCLGLKVTGIILIALVGVAVALLTFYDPSSLAQQHKTAADDCNGMWRRLDLVLLRSRHSRDAFWDFMTPLKSDYERMLANAPPTRAQSKAGQAANRLVIGIGSILTSTTARRPSHPPSSSGPGPVPPPMPPPPQPMRSRPIVPTNPQTSLVVADSLASTSLASTTAVEFDLMLDDVEARTTRRLQKIKRQATTTLNTLEEAAPPRQHSDQQPRWYKKRTTHSDDEDD